MDNKIDDHAFLNYSSGKYSYNDYLKVKNWFSRAQPNNGIRELLLKQWNELIRQHQGKSSLPDYLFKNIHYAILTEEKKPGKGRVLWNRYRQIAAILLIPVLVFSLWVHLSSGPSRFLTGAGSPGQGLIEINAPDGGRVKFCLPDSSCGWLNSGSKLKYAAAFNRHRKVELTGEAYFEVKHQHQSGFTVSVEAMDIRVLGTRFNVSAYTDDQFTSVVLKEGKVDVTGKNGSFSHTLSPDEKITFDQGSKSIEVAKVDADRYIAWKDGYLIIENEMLEQVAGSLERWYNADIDIQGEKLKRYRFKATFREEPLEEVLRLIAKSTPIQYSLSERETDSDGVFKKRKVTISSR